VILSILFIYNPGGNNMSNSSLSSYDKITKLFDEAIELHIDNKLDEALDLFQKILLEDKDSAECHNSIGDIQLKKGNFDASKKSYELAYNLKPDFEDYVYDYALILSYVGELEKSKTLLLKSIEMEPSHVQIYSTLGRIEVETGNYENSLDFLRRSILNDKSDIVSRYYLSIALNKLGQKKESELEFEKVIDRFKSSLTIYPNNPEGYYFIGLANTYLGNYETAAINLKRAIELDTPELDYHYKDGLTYHDFDAFVAYSSVLNKLGKKKEALENIEEALKINPNSDKAKELKKKIG
jgi:tetratricopeptide (TPR) repeat protein